MEAWGVFFPICHYHSHRSIGWSNLCGSSFPNSLKLALIVLAIIPVYVVITVWYSRRMSASTRKVSESSAEMAGVVFETLNGLEEIKVQGRNNATYHGFITKQIMLLLLF